MLVSYQTRLGIWRKLRGPGSNGTCICGGVYDDKEGRLSGLSETTALTNGDGVWAAGRKAEGSGVIGAVRLGQFCNSLMLFCSVAVVGLALALCSPFSSVAHAQVAKSGAVIACFHKKIGRFTAQAHPSRCNISGYRGRDREFVEVPVKGVNWGHWGLNPTRGAYGHNKRNGKGVRIIAYKPITCDEGRTWYSRVIVVFPGEGTFFGLRLPTCDDPAVIGWGPSGYAARSA